MISKAHIIRTLLLLTAIITSLASCMQAQVDEKPKLIVTTDIGGDPDDTQSLVRLLLYSNDLDLCGIIASASGTRGELGVDTIQPGRIHALIDAYEMVWSNLVKHNAQYPTASYLRSIVKEGNPRRGLQSIGENHDTEASRWIIEQVDISDEIINIAIWGGQTDVVQALWRVRNDRSKAEYLDFIEGIRIFDINDQDGIYPYIREEFPGLFYILAKAPEGVDKREGAYRGMYLGGDESLTSEEWINTYVKKDHGPLGALYPMKTWTAPNPHGVMKEGDTPSWFFTLQTGLQDPDHPKWGGWGGRYEPSENAFYRDGEDFAGSEFHARASVYRWRPFFQADFARRMDQCVLPPGEVNRPPSIVLEGDASKEILEIAVGEGETVTLNTIGTSDPDGDSLSYSWWIYPEAGTAQQCPEMWPVDQPDVAVEIPTGEDGREMHLVLEVTDDGEPALTSFRRVIFRIE